MKPEIKYNINSRNVDMYERLVWTGYQVNIEYENKLILNKFNVIQLE